MLFRPPRPRYRRPACPYPPPPVPRYDGYQEGRPRFDGYQDDFPIHPSRRARGGGPPPPRGPRPAHPMDYPPSHMRGRGRPPVRLPNNPPPRRLLPREAHRPPLGHPPQHRPPPQPNSADYYRDAYMTEESEYDPYSVGLSKDQDFYDPYNLESGELIDLSDLTNID